MADIVPLGKPTVDEADKLWVIEQLEGMLARARAGEVEHVIVIEVDVDGWWKENIVGVDNMHVCDFVGKLEIIKQSFINRAMQRDKEKFGADK